LPPTADALAALFEESIVNPHARVGEAALDALASLLDAQSAHTDGAAVSSSSSASCCSPFFCSSFVDRVLPRVLMRLGDAKEAVRRAAQRGVQALARGCRSVALTERREGRQTRKANQQQNK
jgi:hypothetical protein